MATQKLYAGAKLRETRLRHDLTQKAFAGKLGISLPYLNQMEHNHRPVSSTVILALVQEFDFDVSELALGDGERMVSDLREALADPVFTDQVPLADLRLIASNGPAFARAFLSLHRAYAEANERLASLDEALGQQEVRAGALPWEEVRDFFHYCDNYIDAVDRAAERFGSQEEIDGAIAAAFEGLGIRAATGDRAGALWEFDAEAGTLWLSPHASPATRRF